MKIVREWNSTQSIILNHGCLPSKFKKKGKFIRGCPYNASQYLVVVLCAKNLNSDYLIGSSEYSNFCHMSLNPKTPKMVINESSTFISELCIRFWVVANQKVKKIAAKELGLVDDKTRLITSPKFDPKVG